jgi:hypothetical protein
MLDNTEGAIQKSTIQRNWQHRVHRTKKNQNKNTTQYVLDTIIRKQTQITQIPRFQVRGGALKKIAPSGGRRENCWCISCGKSRFYAKKSYFFQF